jgi:hypothetical protein
MGDHRANIKIEMEFHGIKKKCDMWINYVPGDECWGVDDRIIDFIRDVYEKGMEEYNKEMQKYVAEQYRKEIETQEKTELKRLIKKYPDLSREKP